jgi:hypothetical protein
VAKISGEISIDAPPEVVFDFVADVRGSLTFIPVGTGTRLRLSWDLRSRGLLEVLSPVMARLGGSQEAEIWADLKRYLESSPAAASRHAPVVPLRVVAPGAQPVASGMSA